jgi:hypothetical protein
MIDMAAFFASAGRTDTRAKIAMSSWIQRRHSNRLLLQEIYVGRNHAGFCRVETMFYKITMMFCF